MPGRARRAGGGDAGVPMGLQHPVSAHSVQLVRMARKALLPPLLPNTTPAPPGLPLPAGAPAVHAALLWEAPGPCQMLSVGAGGSMGSRAGGGEHPASPCQRYRARGWSCCAWQGGWHGGGQRSPERLSRPEPPREGQSPSEGWKCCTPP